MDIKASSWCFVFLTFLLFVVVIAVDQKHIEQLRAENQQLKEQLDKTCTAYCDYQLPE